MSHFESRYYTSTHFRGFFSLYQDSIHNIVTFRTVLFPSISITTILMRNIEIEKRNQIHILFYKDWDASSNTKCLFNIFSLSFFFFWWGSIDSRRRVAYNSNSMKRMSGRSNDGNTAVRSIIDNQYKIRHIWGKDLASDRWFFILFHIVILKR